MTLDNGDKRESLESDSGGRATWVYVWLLTNGDKIGPMACHNENKA